MNKGKTVQTNNDALEDEKNADAITIRRADTADAAKISKLLLTSFLQFQQLYTEKAFADTTISAEKVVQRISEGPVWVAIKNNRVVGTVSVVNKQEGLYLRGMAVLPDARGSKIGWRLLEQVEKYAIVDKINRMFLCTTPHLHSAIHLYNKFGFKQIGEVDDSFYGTLNFQMEKWLNNSKS